MVAFFIPAAVNPEQAEKVLSAVAQFIREDVPPPEKRLFRISFTHNGKAFTAEVGKPLDRYYQEGDHLVVAILGTDPLKVCLANRGVVRGEPVLVGAWTVTSREFFDRPTEG
ncbi:hypothetical protein [Muricoccus aerilatus]|uniref:hypothetical protein n=1 Tax=Muricoccus aerilatus TaxID=452982 RepID=UPI0005C1C79A|nr:hypothetical protein [Roseomonas aerilata]